jgi:hypothetical protein
LAAARDPKWDRAPGWKIRAVARPRGPSVPRGALRRAGLLSISLSKSRNSEGSMARSKSKQKVKRHRHKLRRNRALARKKAAKSAKS